MRALLLLLAACQSPSMVQAPPPVSLEVAPAISGAAIEMTALGADPGARVYFGYSPQRGAGPCPPALGGACLELLTPVIVGTVVADNTGTATLMATPPPLPPGLTFTVQAAQLSPTPSLSPAVDVTVQLDNDGDGVGGPEHGGLDCDDTDARVYPGATYWADADGDGFGDAIVTDTPATCGVPADMATNDEDCDDTDASIRPGASDPEDGIDQDCDGSEAAGWVDLVMTQHIGCGVDNTDELTCWGWHEWGDSPTGSFTNVSASPNFLCGLRTDGSLECWGGQDNNGNLNPPSGTFGALDVGWRYGCALDDSQQLQCWGANVDGQATPPSGSFLQVSAGSSHTCGIRDDLSIECWGTTRNNLTQAPTGSFSTVSAGLNNSCAIDLQGALHCWGLDNNGESQPPSGTDWSSVECMSEVCCALDSAGMATCWGNAANPSFDVPQEPLSSLFLDLNGGCAVRPDGTGVCWGHEESGRTHLPGETIQGLSGDGSLICWLDVHEQIQCIGRTDIAGPEPVGRFKDIAVEDAFACAIDTAGSLTCWGYNPGDRLSLNGAYARDVSVGNDHVCILDEVGAISCIGSNTFGVLQPPTGNGYTAIASGQSHTCAIRANGRVDCWGRNNVGQASPPTDRFTALTGGINHTCGIRVDGTLDCWGSRQRGITSPPAGQYTQIAASFQFTCALRDDGQPQCWGADDRGETMPPTMQVQEITTGGNYACGVQDSELVCWGAWFRDTVDETPL